MKKYVLPIMLSLYLFGPVGETSASCPGPTLEEAFEQANAGDPLAQIIVGRGYSYGGCFPTGKGGYGSPESSKSLPRDLRKAEQWYRKAADQGHTRAEKLLNEINKQQK